MMKKTVSFAIATALISACALAQDATKTDTQQTAQQSGSQQGVEFNYVLDRMKHPYTMQADKDMQAYDTDKDKRLSESEGQADPALVSRWAEFDINADGSIDVAEYYLFAAHRHIESLEGKEQDMSSMEEDNKTQQPQSSSQSN